jgi:hypothetical protein
VETVLVLNFAKTHSELKVLATLLKLFFSSGKICQFGICVFLHSLTIFIAYNNSGQKGAILTALLPGLAEVFWVFPLWINNSKFFYGYLFRVMTR